MHVDFLLMFFESLLNFYKWTWFDSYSYLICQSEDYDYYNLSGMRNSNIKIFRWMIFWFVFMNSSLRNLVSPKQHRFLNKKDWTREITFTIFNLESLDEFMLHVISFRKEYIYHFLSVDAKFTTWNNSVIL